MSKFPIQNFTSSSRIQSICLINFQFRVHFFYINQYIFFVLFSNIIFLHYLNSSKKTYAKNSLIINLCYQISEIFSIFPFFIKILEFFNFFKIFHESSYFYRWIFDDKFPNFFCNFSPKFPQIFYTIKFEN